MKTFLTIRLAGLAALAFVMHAAPVSYLSPTPDPFFLSIAGFGLSGSPKIPFGPLQASNNISSNFTYVDPVHRFDGPDEIAQMTATFSGEIWNAAGTTDLGPYAATGDATFVFLGRTSDEPGSWTAEMTVDDLTVNAFGHYFNLTLGSTAMGRLSVSPPTYIGGYGDGARFAYPITLYFPMVDGVFSVDPPGLGYHDGGYSGVHIPFEIEAANTAATAPEPRTFALLLVPLAAVIRYRRRRS